jgi:hypothetical protein
MPTITLNSDGSFPLQEITAELYKLTDEYSIETYPAKHREHLGASAIGEECYRKLYYDFRWVKLQNAEPRMRRLWARGHSEEEKIDKILTWMGFFVREIDPVTNKQYKFSAVEGHYGGSGDGIALLPWFREDDSKRILVEKKTFKNDLFNKLKGAYNQEKTKGIGEGLITSNPKYWAQQCAYGRAFKLNYSLFIAVNKDNDEIHYELNKLDWDYALLLENKARDVIYAKEPPARISENPVFYKCKWCHHQDVCHHGEVVETNCRSCKMAVPAPNGEWGCNKFNMLIPEDFIKVGCEHHQSVNE